MPARIKESDLHLPILKLLAASKTGFLSTSQLIDKLQKEISPTGKDDDLIQGRNDTFFSQKVRNIISHKDTSTNPINRGWVEYDSENNGLRITDLGRTKI